jgi:type I restriction enzyme S subunit
LGWVRSTTAHNFPLEKLRDLPLPLPSLAEQRQVAQLLDKADVLRAQRRTTIADVEAFADAIFTEMFGDPVANDRSWPPTKVGDFVAGFQSGKNIAASADDSADGYRILKVSAVTSGIFDPTESKPAPPNYVPPSSHIVRDGDLLFSRANTSELVGATAFAESPSPNLLLPDKLWRFVWYTPARVDPRYVHYLFQRPAFREVVSRNATGTSGSMKNISQAKVLAIACGLPPLGLQQTFGSRITHVERLRRSQAQQLVEMDALFSSLQHRAFRGGL